MQYITYADPVIVGSFANAQSKRATNLRRVARRYISLGAAWNVESCAIHHFSAFAQDRTRKMLKAYPRKSENITQCTMSMPLMLG